MSRAGKFIPGGAGRKTTSVGAAGGARTGPIRAPEPGAGGEPPSGNKRMFSKGSSLVKPVPKSQRMPIVLMSVAVCCLLFAAAYFFAYVPEVRKAAEAEQQKQEVQKQLADLQTAQQKAQADLQKQKNAALATITVDTKPTGANVTIGDSHKQTPATFNDIHPGTVTVVIQTDGYRDYKQDITVTAEKPTDLGTIELVQKTGNLAMSSPQTDVTYTLVGPGDFKREGQLPDKLQNLPAGDYQVTIQQRDWKMQPITFTIHDQENVQKEIKFPYASLAITSTPPGATVRMGRTILGKTPLSLSQVHPDNLNISVDLPPYTIQRFVLVVPDFGNVTKNVTLEKDQDFIAACGMDMIWIPDGYWVGKYEVRQSEFETVAGFNPSYFRRPNRPVDSITWEAATAFCDKLTQYERKAGKLPSGYHYGLPTESQWASFSADADINQAAMSRGGVSLSSTQEVGASEPNKYGIYDTLGNIWEWCLDQDDRGNHSVRGGSWLSSAENFPSADTRSASAPKYADRFTGFRVLLVPN
jgi:hypothetical protein